MHRRSRKKRLAAVIAGGALAAGALVYLPSLASASTDAPTNTTRQHQFEAASAKYHVPQSVLMGVAYQESLFDQHSGYNTTGGYGPMNLTDVTPAMMAGGSAGAVGRSDLAAMTADPSLHTLNAAAKLTGIPAAKLRTDPQDNIEGGAALLASYQKSLTGSTSGTAANWYGAVAKFSQSKQKQTASTFANEVFAKVKAGVQRTTNDGQRVQLKADTTLSPDTAQVSRLHLRSAATTATDCPSSVSCTFIPAATTTYQVSDRPANGIKINTIVIHDTEGSYQSAINTFQAPGATDAANYIVNSADGSVTELVSPKDVAFHAGNYTTNLHAVGIEHDGFAAQGATWFTETQYQTTAKLVKYLAKRYDIPLDREHIIGHDDVAGPQDGFVAGMHWDPGPQWDWSHFMSLIGAPTDKGRHGVGPVGSVVTIAPGFKQNKQTFQVCPADDPSGLTTTCTKRTESSSVLFVRTAPSKTAPLFPDPAIHPGATAGTDEINDWGNTVSDGQQFVVAGKKGAWTAIWYSGKKVWFDNPGGENTIPAHGVRVIKAAGTTPVQVFGEDYPLPSEYPAGLSPDAKLPISFYLIPPGQGYVATQPAQHTSDFFPSHAGAVVIGKTKMYTIQLNHRLALVNSTDVTAHRN